MKDFIVYEILWEHCEYGGPCYSSAPSLHASLENAMSYKERRENAFNNKPGGEDLYSYHGSEPKVKIVRKKEYDSIVANDLK